MRRIVGIDPGLAGGLGVLDLDGAGHFLGVALHRTPTLTIHRGKKARVEYDVPAMFELLMAQALDGVWERLDNIVAAAA